MKIDLCGLFVLIVGIVYFFWVPDAPYWIIFSSMGLFILIGEIIIDKGEQRVVEEK